MRHIDRSDSAPNGNRALKKLSPSHLSAILVAVFFFLFSFFFRSFILSVPYVLVSVACCFALDANPIKAPSSVSFREPEWCLGLLELVFFFFLDSEMGDERVPRENEGAVPLRRPLNQSIGQMKKVFTRFRFGLILVNSKQATINYKILSARMSSWVN